MKYYISIFSLVSMILLSGCSSKQDQLIAASTITNYTVDKNAILVEEKIQNESPFKIQTYEVKIKDSEHISMFHKQDSIEVILSDISKNGKILQYTASITGRVLENHHKKELLLPGLQLLMHELHNRGHKYFQILKPTSLSNLNGFPLNTIAGLSAYLSPELNNPSEDNELENADGMDVHSSINSGFTVFDDSIFELTIIVIDEPKSYQIVWNVEDNL